MPVPQQPTSAAIRAEQRIRYNTDPHLQAAVEQVTVLYQIRAILIATLIVVPLVLAALAVLVGVR
jgi:hypothetical protein